MKTKYSLVHLTDITKSPAELIRIAAKTGFDCVSLRTIPMGLKNEVPYDIARDNKMFRETKEALEETGVEFNDIENARIFEGVDIKSYEPCMEAAAKLNVKHVLTNIWTSDKSYYLEKFCELCELGKRYEQTINVEFVTWANVTNMKQAKELLEESKMNNVGIVVDALHFYRSRVELSEFDEMPASWFNFMHLCDAGEEIPTEQAALIHTGRAERYYPGEGVIDMKSILAKIPHVIRGIEIPHLERIAAIGGEEHTRKAIQSTKIYFGDE